MTAEAAKPVRRAGEFWGGLAAMLVAAPSAIGYGVAAWGALGPGYAGKGALAGLLGCAAIGLAAPLCGGTPRLVSAPCGPAAVLLAAFAGPLAAAGTPAETILFQLGLVGLLAALLQLAYGIAGGGKLIKYIPYPVVAGYLSGVGVLLFADQVPKLLGLPRGSGWAGLVAPGLWDAPALAVGAATIAGMILGPRLTKRIPAVILGLGAGFLAYAGLAAFLPALRTVSGNPRVVGAFAASLPEIAAAAAARAGAAASATPAVLSAVLVPALTLSVLLSIDTLKTCVILDTLTRSRHDSHRELRGQGVANLLSAVLGGMPGAGTIGATLVNLSSGGSTRLSGVLAGGFGTLAFVLCSGFFPGLPNLIAWIPKTALAGILLVVSFRMIDRHSVSLLRHRSTVLDFVVILAVVVTALTTSLIAASAVGLGLCFVLFIRDQIRGSVIRRKAYGSEIASRIQRPALQAELLKRRGGETVVSLLQGTLFFGTTDQLFTLLEPDLKTCRTLILDLRRVQTLDYTAAHLLDHMAAMLGDRGAALAFCDVPAVLPTGRDLPRYLRQLGLVTEGRNVRLFDTLDDALRWAEDRILESAGHRENPSAPPLAVRDFDLFREFDEEALGILESALRPRAEPAGRVLFRQGESGDELFLIRRGTVDLHLALDAGRRRPLASLRRGSFFGDMAFLDRGTRSADAVVAADADLFVLSRADFDALSRRRPEAGAMLFGRMARILSFRLRQADDALRTLEEA